MLKSFNNYSLMSEIDFNLLNTPSPAPQGGADPFMKELARIEQSLISMIDTQFRNLEQTLTGHVQSQMRQNRPFTSKLRSWWRKTWNPNAPHDEAFDPSKVALDLPEHIKLELPSFVSLQEEKVVEELLSILSEGPIQDTSARLSVELQRLKQEIINNVMTAFRTVGQHYQANAAQGGQAPPQAAQPQQAPSPKPGEPFDWTGKLKSWQASQQPPKADEPPDDEPEDTSVDPAEKERKEREEEEARAKAAASSAPEPAPSDPAAPVDPAADPATVVPGKKGRTRKNKNNVLTPPNIGGEEPTAPPAADEPPAPPAEEEPPAPPAEEPAPEEKPLGEPTAPPARPKINLGGMPGFKGKPAVPGMSGGPGTMSASDTAKVFARPGVIPVSATGARKTGIYDGDKEATRVDAPHTNAAQHDTEKMLDLWGPGVKAFYKAQTLGNSKRGDTEARKNIYSFLTVLSKNPDTRKYMDYIKKFPLPKILNWVQAFPPEQQLDIASKLPFLDDGLNEEDPTITKTFWDRVDKDSFYRAVQKTLGSRYKPDYALMAKYVENNLKDRVKTLLELLKGPYQAVGQVETPEGTLSQRLEKYRQMLGS